MVTTTAKAKPSWWRHQMETFSALLAICAGNSPVSGEFPTQRPVTRSFDVFFYLRPNKRLSKQSWGWWFETQSYPLWRHRNDHTSHYWVSLEVTTRSAQYKEIHIWAHYIWFDPDTTPLMTYWMLHTIAAYCEPYIYLRCPRSSWINTSIGRTKSGNESNCSIDQSHTW